MPTPASRSPWDLVSSGAYAQAAEAYTRLYEESGRPSHLRNRGLATLLAGEYEAALRDFRAASQAEDPRYVSDNDSVFQGICHWYLGRWEQSVSLWTTAVGAPYTDAAGGVEVPALLLYAGTRRRQQQLQRDAWRLLRRHARRKLGQWPGPIVPYLLGKMGTEELMQRAAATRSAGLRDRWLCQADFYVGLLALTRGDETAYRAGMAACAAHELGYLEHEYFLARWELSHGAGPQPE